MKRTYTFLRSDEFLALCLALVGVLCALTVAQHTPLPRSLVALGLLPSLIYYVIAASRDRRRKKALGQPFPLSYREILVRRVPFYRQLDVTESQRFEEEIQFFLAEQRIYPLRAATPEETAQLWRHFPGGLTEEHRVLIAASAATLLIGRPDWRLPTVRDIVIYPMPFAMDTYELSEWGDTVGKVHASGPIILSLPEVLRAYPERSQSEGPTPDVTSNVAIHEFAHVLDFMGSDGRAGGVPSLLSPLDQARWQRQLALEHGRILAGSSVLHPYGTRSDAELFAVAVESFFMDALRLRTLHPDLYQMLSEFFQQDPAARILPGHAQWLFRPLFGLSAPTRYVA
jgi:hypothetical protein